jgi:hypothetical protein
VPEIKQNDPVNNSHIAESPMQSTATAVRASFSEVVKSAQKVKPSENQIIKINHPKPHVKPLQPKQPSNLAPSSRSRAFITFHRILLL